MTPAIVIAGVVFVATLLWAFAGVLAVEWITHLRRSETGARVSVVVDLLGALVPVVIMFIALVFSSAIFGVRSGVVLLALVVPGGLAFALWLQVKDTPHPWSKSLRVGATAGVVCAITLWRAL